MRVDMKRRILITVSIAVLVITSACKSNVGFFTELPVSDLQGWRAQVPLELSDEVIGFDKMIRVAAEDDLELYFNEKTTEIAVKTKDDQIWFSNPQNRMELSTSSLEKYSAPLLVNVIDMAESSKQMNAFSDCVKYGQFRYELTDNGIRIEYLFGRIVATPIYPQAFTAERFREITGSLSDQDRGNMERYYLEVNYDTVKDQQALKDLKDKYARIDEVKHIFTLKQSPSPIETNRITQYLTELGYTSEDREIDHYSVGYTDPERSRGNFIIPVEYTINDNKLTARVITDEIKVTTNIKIDNMTLLPFFNTEGGHLESRGIIPDGSGAVIELSHIRSAGTAEYDEPIYGRDHALYQPAQISVKKNLYFPMFGITTAESSMYAVIRSADATASVYASPRYSEKDICGLGAKFKFIDYAKVKLTAADTETVNNYADHPIEDEIIVDYTFLAGNNSWTGIAADYRRYLTEEGILPAADEEMRLPVMIELIGAIDDIEPFLGVPKEVIRPLTSFSQAVEIAGELSEIFPDSELVVRYRGWQRGGMKSAIASDGKAERLLGGNRGFALMVEAMNKLGVRLFPDVDLQYVYRDRNFDGFSITRNTVRFITSEAAYKPQYNKANFLADRNGTYGYILDPRLLKETVSQFIRSSSAKDLTGFSLPNMAKDLSGNYSRRSFLTRNEAKEFSIEAAAEIRGSDNMIMASGANAYMLPYLDYAVELPVASNPHPMTDSSIPFTQMILAGRISYSAEQLNDSMSDTYYLLKCIETGSAMYFTAIYEPNSLLKGTSYDGFLAVDYDLIRNRAEAVGMELQKALGPVYGHEMINHVMLDEGVYRTDYSNGISLIVNYNTVDFRYGSDIVPATGWSHTERR